MNFNKEQLMAINHIDGACGVIAGAGSGKSTVLVNRIDNLINNHNVNPSDIVAITFTSNSAKDLKQKLYKLDIDDVNVGTFHSICSKILYNNGIDVTKKLQKFEIENLFKKMNDNEKVEVDDILSFISYQKNYNKSFKDEFIDKESKYSEEELRKYYQAYEELKESKQCYDWDDYLLLTLNLFKSGNYTYNHCEYILVDEHQDSNLVQNELIDLMCPNGNVFCVFDYRQAIYTFRGGNPEYCMNFKKKYKDATIINLNMNYRSSNNIVTNANEFIKKYYGDYEFYNDSIPSSDNNSKILKITSIDRQQEAKEIADKIELYLNNGVSPNEIAVLYRLNSHSFEIENELKSRNIDYNIDNEGGFFKRNEIEIILCVMRLINNPKDNIAYEFLFKSRVSVFRCLKNSVMDDIKKLSAEKDLSFLDASELVKTDAPWQSKNLIKFSNLINNLTRQSKSNKKLKTIVENIINGMDMINYIEGKYSSQEEIDDRIKSLNTFKEFIRENTLESFIAYVYGKSRTQKKNDKNKIQLMSIHKSKGLEFENVFVIGIEDGKFPNIKTNVIDEARLFYVAITRSKKDLYLSQIYDGNTFVDEYFKNIKTEKER